MSTGGETRQKGFVKAGKVKKSSKDKLTKKSEKKDMKKCQ